VDDRIAAARAALGQELHTYRWVVEEGQVRQFLRATRPDGLAGTSSDDVPVCFTVTTGLWGISHPELLEALGLDVGRVVHGEQRFEVSRMLEVGEEYIVRHRVSDVHVKLGRRAGRMLVVVVETTVEDADGELCVRELHTSIQTER
jgi:hypothetical protein